MHDLSLTIKELLKKIDPPIAAALGHVDLSLPLPPPVQFLSAGEKVHLAALCAVKRRRQWLGGRLAAKEALIELFTGQREQWQITNSADGRPRANFLPDPGRFRVDISISHSHDLAVALAVAGGYACGIDVELMACGPTA